MNKRIVFIFLAAATLLSVTDCKKDSTGPDFPEYDRVMTLISVGTNNLSNTLEGDIKRMTDISNGCYVPDVKVKQALLVLAHHFDSKDYSRKTSPCLIRIYRKGTTVTRDTVKTWDAGARLTDKSILLNALSFINTKYRSEHHGILYSSHGTGWLPEGYYQKIPTTSLSSIGAESLFDGQNEEEMDIKDLAEAIPMHLDYLICDACLMGGIEVAYQLKDKVSQLAVSPAEIISEGIYYPPVTNYLLNKYVDGPKNVCESFYNHYNEQSGFNRTATITLVDCSKLEPLEQICKVIFNQYEYELKNMDYSNVQTFFRFNRHYYYDLYDIAQKAGVNDTLLEKLKEAIDGCIIYKNHTPEYCSVPIGHYCGFSMYLPANGNSELDTYYKNLAWNKATNLVK